MSCEIKTDNLLGAVMLLVVLLFGVVFSFGGTACGAVGFPGVNDGDGGVWVGVVEVDEDDIIDPAVDDIDACDVVVGLAEVAA